MEIPTWKYALKCSGCEQEIDSGETVYVICEHCVAAFGFVDPRQLTLFELPAPKELH